MNAERRRFSLEAANGVSDFSDIGFLVRVAVSVASRHGATDGVRGVC
ncbi:hypothetical protein [Paracoccus pacificus]|uniref:Uncharacterized protein n=1 Tax=Paracoccus pacificus TaxID=1463598 RepID=A0ABW4R3P8_9RHOB